MSYRVIHAYMYIHPLSLYKLDKQNICYTGRVSCPSDYRAIYLEFIKHKTTNQKGTRPRDNLASDLIATYIFYELIFKLQLIWRRKVKNGMSYKLNEQLNVNEKI